MANRKKRKESAVIDSAATSSFWRLVDEHIETNELSNKMVSMPTGTTAKTSKKALLPNTKLNKQARELDLLPELRDNSLISVCKLADAGYTTIFHAGDGGVTVHWHDDVFIRVSKEAVLKGWRDESGLWRVPIKDKVENENTDTLILQRPLPTEAALSVYDLPSTEKIVRYLHAALGFPTKATMLKAIRNGWLVGWPGLTIESVNAFFPESNETQQGHMKSQRQGVRSTSSNEKEKDQNEEENSLSQAGKKHKDVFVKVWDTQSKIFTDQTGKFPYQSVAGNRYLMVMVEIDSNYIDAEPMKSKSGADHVKAYLALMKRITATGVCDPKMHILDNEASEEYQDEIKKHTKMQMVPPDTHQRNIAERAIQTFKNHFTAILAGVDPKFPIFLWCKLLPQAVLTLNLMRPSNVAPKISAHAYMHGQFNYDAMPLAPMGCAVQLYLKPHRRKTWGKHSVDGWYLGASDKHYRCHKVWNVETKAERVSDTVFFKHKYITQPTLTPEDVMIRAILNLRNAIQKAKDKKGDVNFEAIKKLDSIFNSPQEGAAPPRVNAQRPRVESSAQKVDCRVPPDAQSPRVPVEADCYNEPTVGPASNTRAAAKKKAIEHCTQILNEEVSPELFPDSKAKVPFKALKELVNAVMDEETGEMLEYRDLLKHPVLGPDWNISGANEFGRLAQGVGNRIKGTDTIKFIRKEDVPLDRRRDVTYGRFVCKVRPEKIKEPNRTRLTAGGNLINYPWDVSTATAEMLLVKIFFNSIISTPGAKFMTMDIKNFYLGTPMKRKEYMRIKLTDIPKEIIDEYKLTEIVTEDGWVYIEISKGMYGLPQSGIIAQEQLAERLERHGYKQSTLIPGYWTHAWRPISFTLVVDDFGVKYTRKEDAEDLLAILRSEYEVSDDWEGKRYIGLTLDWDYAKRKVHLSMPGFVGEACKEFKHPRPKRKQDSPYPWSPPKYGAKQQYAKQDSNEPILGKDEIKYIQRVVGKFNFFARAIDGTMQPALSALASEQAAPTASTMKKVKQFLDYALSQEEAVLTFSASDMILAGHSDGSYLSEKNARSRAGGHWFLSNDSAVPPFNGAILNISQIIKAVMSSAAEAELGALFINAREAAYIRKILIEMGHPQPRTPLQTDNSTAEGVVNKNVQTKKLKSMDMRFHWLRDRESQGQFRIYWRPGKTNRADYWSKTQHPPSHHRDLRSQILTPLKVLLELRKRQ